MSQRPQGHQKAIVKVYEESKIRASDFRDVRVQVCGGDKILMSGFTSSNGTGVKGPESGWNYQFWFTVRQRGCGFFIP